MIPQYSTRSYCELFILLISLYIPINYGLTITNERVVISNLVALTLASPRTNQLNHFHLSPVGKETNVKVSKDSNFRGSSRNGISYRTNDAFQPHVRRKRQECLLSTRAVVSTQSELNGALNSCKAQKCHLSHARNNCDQWLDLLLCGVARVKQGLRSDVSQSLDGIYRLTAAVRMMKFKTEQLGRNFVSSGLEDLRSELKSLQRITNDILTQRKDGSKELCVMEITRGNIPKAVNIFTTIGVNSELIDIIGEAYKRHGRLNNLKNIVDFGSALPRCVQTEIAYTVLFGLIKDDGYLNNPIMFYFHSAVDKCCRNTTIDRELSTSVNKTFSSFIDSMSKSNLSYLSPLIKDKYRYARKYYPMIIGSGYNMKNFKTIFKFIIGTPYIEDECICLKLLYEHMQKHSDLDTSEFLMLVYRVYKIMDMPAYNKTLMVHKTELEALKKRFPIPIERLIWNNANCTILNLGRNGDLVATSHDTLGNRMTGKVYAIPEVKHSSGNVHKDWGLYRRENAEFFVLNKRNSYLHFGGEKGGRGVSAKDVPVEGLGDSYFWKLKPFQNGEYFSIVDKVRGQKLYAEDHYEFGIAGFPVTTWTGNQEPTDDNWKWKIRC